MWSVRQNSDEPSGIAVMFLPMIQRAMIRAAVAQCSAMDIHPKEFD
jgi:hypothetical protein